MADEKVAGRTVADALAKWDARIAELRAQTAGETTGPWTFIRLGSRGYSLLVSSGTARRMSPSGEWIDGEPSVDANFQDDGGEGSYYRTSDPDMAKRIMAKSSFGTEFKLQADGPVVKELDELVRLRNALAGEAGMPAPTQDRIPIVTGIRSNASTTQAKINAVRKAERPIPMGVASAREAQQIVGETADGQRICVELSE